MLNPSSLNGGKSVIAKMVNYFSTEAILSSDSRESCMKKIKNVPSIKMKSAKPVSKAGVLVPLCIDNGEMSLLYTLRSMDLTSHKGQVSFPGGKFDLSDGNLTETALRETDEELGIPKHMVDVWGEGGSLPGRNFDIMVTPVIGFVKDYDISKLKINEKEVEEVFTVPLKVLADPQFFGFTKFKNGFTMPVFMGGKHKIWGLTATFTHIFLSCLLPESSYSMQFKYLSLADQNSNSDLLSKL